MPIRVGVARSRRFRAVPPSADSKNEKERLLKTQTVWRSLDNTLVPAGRASTSFSFQGHRSHRIQYKWSSQALFTRENFGVLSLFYTYVHVT